MIDSYYVCNPFPPEFKRNWKKNLNQFFMKEKCLKPVCWFKPALTILQCITFSIIGTLQSEETGLLESMTLILPSLNYQKTLILRRHPTPKQSASQQHKITTLTTIQDLKSVVGVALHLEAGNQKSYTLWHCHGYRRNNVKKNTRVISPRGWYVQEILHTEALMRV